MSKFFNIHYTFFTLYIPKNAFNSNPLRCAKNLAADNLEKLIVGTILLNKVGALTPFKVVNYVACSFLRALYPQLCNEYDIQDKENI